MSKVTVFYDGACPLCSREIAFLKRLDRRERIRFTDISPPDADAFCPVPRARLLARFHVRRKDGTLVEGAEAFTELYAEFPLFGWLRPVGRFAPSRWVLNRLYDVFLWVRPILQRFVPAAPDKVER